MSLITDGILIAASLTACFYCLVLNIRLKALRDTKTGIGGSITQLSKGVGELETSLAETKASHQHSAEKLEDLVGEAGTLADFLADLLEKAGDAGLPSPASSKQSTATSREPGREEAEDPEETPAMQIQDEIALEDGNAESPSDAPSEQDQSEPDDEPGDNSKASEDQPDPESDVISIEMVDPQDAPLKAGVG